MKDEGVSSVVSAVLIFALFSTAFLLWTINQQPEWVADREHNHIRGVQEDIASLQSGLERLSASGDSGPITQTIALAADPLPLVQAVPGQGALSMEGTFAFDASFTNPALHSLDRTAVGDPSATSASTVENVLDLRSLEISLTSSGVNGGSSSASVILTASDGSQTATLTLRHSRTVTGCPGTGVAVDLAGPTGSRTRIDFCDADNALTDHRLNALDPQFGFPGALSRLDDGYDMSLSTATSGGASATGTYAAAWIDTDGKPRVAGSGLSSPGYTQALSSTPLQFDNNPIHFENQDVTWEGGAVLVSQGGNQVVTRDPSFLLSVDGTDGFLRWTVIVTEGTGGVGGAGSAELKVTHDATQTILMTADAAQFTLTSDRADGWAAFFNDQITLAGTTDASASAAAGQATLDLSQGTVTEWTIELRIIYASIALN